MKIFEGFQHVYESSLSRIWKHIEGNKGFGVISPYRSDYSVKENEQRYRDLKSEIRSLGYGFIEMEGGFKEESGWVLEKSLFVPNIKRDDLVELGQKYEQFSVIYKDAKEFVEIGTNDFAGIGVIQHNFIKQGWNKNMNFDSELTQQFFSSLAKGSHRGRKFLFQMECELYEIVPKSFNEMAYGNKRLNVIKLL